MPFKNKFQRRYNLINIFFREADLSKTIGLL